MKITPIVFAIALLLIAFFASAQCTLEDTYSTGQHTEQLLSQTDSVPATGKVFIVATNFELITTITASYNRPDLTALCAYGKDPYLEITQVEQQPGKLVITAHYGIHGYAGHKTPAYLNLKIYGQ